MGSWDETPNASSVHPCLMRRSKGWVWCEAGSGPTVSSGTGGAGQLAQSGPEPSVCPHNVGDRTAAPPGTTLLQLWHSTLTTIAAHGEGCGLKRGVASSDEGDVTVTC